MRSAAERHPQARKKVALQPAGEKQTVGEWGVISSPDYYHASVPPLVYISFGPLTLHVF